MGEHPNSVVIQGETGNLSFIGCKADLHVL